MKMADPDEDKKDLTHALGLSSLAYFSNKFIIKNLTALGMPYKILEYKDMKCIIAESDSSIFISFRGTEPSKWSNWKRILNIIPKPFIYGLQVHGGFRLYHKEYENFVKEFIDSINREKKIIFTGHSLGAALASLFNISYTKSSSSILFACPNYLYNSIFVTPNSTSYQILQDFVTWIPITIPFIKWTRSSDTIKAKTYKKYLNPISYHSLENYIKSILKD